MLSGVFYQEGNDGVNPYLVFVQKGTERIFNAEVAEGAEGYRLNYIFRLFREIIYGFILKTFTNLYLLYGIYLSVIHQFLLAMALPALILCVVRIMVLKLYHCFNTSNLQGCDG